MSCDSVSFSPLHRVIDSNWGSEQAWALNLAQSAAAAGLDCRAVIGEADPDAVQELRKSGIEVVLLHLGRRQTLYESAAFYSKVWSLGKQWKLGVLHHAFPLGFNLGFSPLAIRKNPRLVVGPVLHPSAEGEDEPALMRRSGSWESRNYGLLSPFLKPMFRATLENAAHVMFISEATRHLAFTQHPHLKVQSSSILPTGGVSSEFFEQASMGQPRNQMVVGTLSYLRKRKHVDGLLRAVSMMRGFDIRLRIGGDGPSLDGLRKLAVDLGIASRTEFAGRIPRAKVPAFLRSLDVMVMLDKIPHEVPPSTQEAMACGVPIVASDPGPIDSVIEKPYGFIVDGLDPSMLAEALGRLAVDSASRIKIGRLAREHALSHYSISAVGAHLREVYDRVYRNG